MGFLSKLFGGDDDKAAKWQREDNREALDFIKKGVAQSRADTIPRFEEAEEKRRAGYNEALRLFGEAIPQRFRLMQEGSQNQQDTFLSGADLYRNAIMGLPVDMSVLRKDPLTVDYSFLEGLALPEREVAEATDPGFDTGEFPINPTYGDPMADNSTEVIAAYDAGASPQASANELAAFNLGVPDVNRDGRISNDEFQSWDGYEAWAQQQGGRFKIHDDRDPGGMQGSRFTGRYLAGVPQYQNPTEAAVYGSGTPSRQMSYQDYLAGLRGGFV